MQITSYRLRGDNHKVVPVVLPTNVADQIPVMIGPVRTELASEHWSHPALKPDVSIEVVLASVTPVALRAIERTQLYVARS